jgi:hypothetical protein
LCLPFHLQQQHKEKNLYGDGTGILEEKNNKKTEEVLI